MEMWFKNLKNDLFSDIFAHYFAISPPTNAISHILALFLERYYHILLYFIAFLPSIQKFGTSLNFYRFRVVLKSYNFKYGGLIYCKTGEEYQYSIKSNCNSLTLKMYNDF